MTGAMLEPLTDDERASTPETDTAREPDNWRPILPVPEDAPRQIPSHKLGKPSASWPYRDAAGRLLGLAVRFDLPDDDKDVLPLTFCEGPDGRREWRWKAFPVPRLLYGLDRLADRPDAPGLVVEGEKAADAAAALFPDHVAVTSPSGSKAAHMADWTPLQGRHVAVWPDHDAQGVPGMPRTRQSSPTRPERRPWRWLTCRSPSRRNGTWPTCHRTAGTRIDCGNFWRRRYRGRRPTKSAFGR